MLPSFKTEKIPRAKVEKLKADVNKEQSARLKHIWEKATILLTGSVELAKVRGETKIQVAVAPTTLFQVWDVDDCGVINTDDSSSLNDSCWKFISSLDRYCSKSGFFFWAKWLPPFLDLWTPCADEEFIKWLFAEHRSKIVCWATWIKNEAEVYSRESIEKAEKVFWQEVKIKYEREAREEQLRQQGEDRYRQKIERSRPSPGSQNETKEMAEARRIEEIHDNEWRWH